MFRIFVLTAVAGGFVLTGILAYAATRPDTFRVQRSVSIKAPPERIFPLINNLKSFNTWNPFLKADPATKLAYSGPDGGLGAAHEWDGSSQVGKGRVEISNALPNAHVTMTLDMIKPFVAHNVVEFTLEPRADATVVNWAMSGRNAYFVKVMGLFLNMDNMVGGEFDKGLAELKSIVER
jgi:carbon monoxide dehydrogenase subunit G